MNQLKQKYTQLESLYEARNLRERILISGLVVAAIINTWLLLLNDPLTISQQKIDTEISTASNKIHSLSQQHALLSKAKVTDPNKDVKNRLAIAQQHIAKLDEQLLLKMKGLILPTQMAEILEQVLSQHTNLQFKRIQSIAAKPFLVEATEETLPARSKSNARPVNSSPATDIGVYQHGIQMEFTGSYLDTLAYLQQLKKLPWHFYWDDVLFDVDDYPQSSIVIRVHTLSLKEGWLGV